MIRTEQNNSLNQELMGEILIADKLLREPFSPVLRTEVSFDEALSETYAANVWLASEVHQPIGAYKIRGAFNFISNLDQNQKERGVVTASAGNHAQGIALCCNSEGVKCRVYMPRNTPANKINRVLDFGGEQTEVKLVGDSFDEASRAAKDFGREKGAVMAHPFNDLRVIAGQGTWGLEIADRVPNIDVVMCPVGGMGLLAGIATAIKNRYPNAQVIGAEPEGAASLKEALKYGRPAQLETISTFVDGASVKEVGELPFRLAGHLVAATVEVSDLELRKATMQLWERRRPLRAELAGALSVAALNRTEDISGKNVVCLISGGNLSDNRYETEVRLSA